MRSSRHPIAALAAVIALLAVIAGVGAPGAQAASSHTLIQGSGSTWAANAVAQWVNDVSAQGLPVVFTGTGSAQGRTDFANAVTDFGVTDIGYQGVDPGTGAQDTNCPPGKGCRAFAYEPIVAGGTSFPYQVKVAGQLVRNLRLSGQTLTKIFTYQITNWDDPAITQDNNGHALPSLPIIPVVHSEGSGSTAQFTLYMNQEFPNIWQPFAKVKSFLEYYPSPSGGEKGVALNGSDTLMNFISSAAANGAIGYDEYSYPLLKGWPVAKVLNRAGYYTLPDQYNVAVALQHAVINNDKSSPNYLLQNLNQVYVAPEPQVYPMSSYSYFLIPTGASDPRMTTAKRQTLADFLFYDVCQGQKEIGPIGYSPLPSNLVQASFAQTTLLGVADPKVNVTPEKSTSLSSCNNPTFVPGHLNVNHLAQIAPLPPACDKQGAGPCNADGSSPSASGATGGGTGGSSGGGPAGNGGTGTGSSGTGSSGTGSSGTGASTTGASGTRKTATGTITGGTGGSGATGNANLAAANGQTVDANGNPIGSGSGDSATGDAQSVPVNLAAYRTQNLTGILGPLAVVELVAVLVVPPLVWFTWLRRRRRTP